MDTFKEVLKSFLWGVPASVAVAGIIIAGIYIPKVVYGFVVLGAVTMFIVTVLGAFVRKYLLNEKF